MSYIKEIVINQNGERRRINLPDPSTKADKATTLSGYGIKDVTLTNPSPNKPRLKVGSSTIDLMPRAEIEKQLSSNKGAADNNAAALEALTEAFDGIANDLHTHAVCEYMHGVNFDPATTKSTAKMFKGDTRLNRVPDWDFSNVVDASYMFDGCTALTEADMDLPAVEKVPYMFAECVNLREANIRCRPITANNMFWVRGDDSQSIETSGCLEVIEGIDFSRANVVGYMHKTDDLRKMPDVIDLGQATNANALFWAPNLKSVAPLSIPDIDFSHLTSAMNLFRGRDNTTRYPAEIDLSNCTDLRCTFYLNQELTEELINRIKLPTDKKFNAEWLFCTWAHGSTAEPWEYECRTTIPTFPSQFDFSKCTNVDMAFAGWTEITEATINVSGVERSADMSNREGNPFINCTKLTKRTYIGLGTHESVTTFPLTQSRGGEHVMPDVWGEGSEEARQTIVDSLLTHSFDRKAAGYKTCQLRISREVVARLTETEKAAIVAKGYSIFSI